jgi:RND family efflux transporter MFP subunit
MATPGGDPLFRLASQGEVEMRGQVAEQDLPNIKVGQSANVRLSGVSEPFKGTVRLLGAVIDPLTRLGEIRVALDPHPVLRPGSFARGEVIVDRAQRQVVPQTAVLSDDKGTYVYIVNGSSQVERRDVKVGGSVPEGIVIASGLKGDERVVATAGSFLRVGERVETTSATAKAS